MARYCQAVPGHQAIHGWPGSAVGPEQIAAIGDGKMCENCVNSHRQLPLGSGRAVAMALSSGVKNKQKIGR